MSNCNKCLKKKAKNYYESIKPQKIITELNDGELQADDYYGRSFDLLPSINTSVPSRSEIYNENTFHLFDLHKILDSNFNSLEHGFCRMNDGLWYLAAKTKLHNVTGDMFEWWFSHCDSSERYKWWHPTCNVHGEYDPTFYAVQPEDRLIGHSIGHRFTYVKKTCTGSICEDAQFEGDDMLQHIDYIHPAEFINTELLPAAGITACIIGKISYQDHQFGEISVGHVCHVVKERMGQATLISRMWLGYIDKTDENFPPPRLVNFIANTLLYRYLRFTYSSVKDIWVQMVQEMSCLGSWLPEFHAQELIELELRRQRNIAAMAAQDDYEEVSDNEVEEDVVQYDEESMPDEESMLEEVREQDVVMPPAVDDPYGEVSMSDDDNDDENLESTQYQISASPYPTTLTVEHDRFYEYDSHDDEKDEIDDERRRFKSKKSSKSKKGQHHQQKRGKYHSNDDSSPISNAVVVPSSSSRVGKGIGI